MKDSKKTLVVVEQGAGRLGFYSLKTGESTGGIKLGLNPHEIVITDDHKTAYVSNFGLQDYDENVGVAGNSISVVDLVRGLEVGEINTGENSAPHGLALRPSNPDWLYVNTEIDQKLKVFDTKTHKEIKSYPIPEGTHNFIFSPEGQFVWLMSGNEGIYKLNPDTGKILDHKKLSSAVRGLSYTPDKQSLLVSGNNEIWLLNPENLSTKVHLTDLGVGQILYSDITRDNKTIVAPAVLNNTTLVIDVPSKKIIKKFVTGIDPVRVKIIGDTIAYVSNARSSHVSVIDLKKLSVKKLNTGSGPNGMAVVAMKPGAKKRTIYLGAVLPLTGKDAKKGREIMYGYEYWKERVNARGGFNIAGSPHTVSIVYSDDESNPKLDSEKAKRLIQNNPINTILDVENTAPIDLNGWKTPVIQLSRNSILPEIIHREYRQRYHVNPSKLSSRAYNTVSNLAYRLDHNLFIPKGEGPFPGVILVHASSGVEAWNYDWAKRLQSAGYAVYLLDAFTDNGIKNRKSVGWDEAVKAELNAIPQAYALLAQAHSVDKNRIGLMGFSLGGYAVLRAMETDPELSQAIRSIPFKLAISYYGHCQRLVNPRFKGQVKIYVGDKDDRSPANACVRLAKKSESKSVSLMLLKGGKHGFDNPYLPASKTLASERGQIYHIGYDPVSSQKAIQDTLEFLKKL